MLRGKASIIVGDQASRRSWRAWYVSLCLGGLAILLGTCWTLAAETPAPLQQTCLLLHNGNLLAGRVTFEQGRYCVADQRGKTWVKPSDVSMLAQDKLDCFAKQKAKLSDEDSEGHVRLAEWCLTQGLAGHAKAELEHVRARKLEHPRLRELDIRVAHAKQQPRTDATVQQATAIFAERHDPLQVWRKSLGERTVAEFIQRTQPILLNRCGSINCHGARSESSFKLQGVARGARPMYRQTSANLEAVLTWVNRAAPDESRLLELSHQAHGNAPQAPFERANQADLLELKRWVSKLAVRKDPARKGLQPAEPTEELVSADEAFTTTEPGRKTPRSAGPGSTGFKRIAIPAQRSPARGRPGVVPTLDAPVEASLLPEADASEGLEDLLEPSLEGDENLESDRQ